jgi:WD40 repeat protein
VWETTSGREVATLRGHTDAVFSLAFSPDGRRLVSGGNRRGQESDTGTAPGETRVWDVATGEQVFELSGRFGDATAVALSPCGRFLATGGREGIVTLLDGTPLAQDPSHEPLPEDR